jgi:hypothetical protein
VDDDRRPEQRDANGDPLEPGIDGRYGDESADDVMFDDPRFDELRFDDDYLASRPTVHAVIAHPEPGFPGFRHNQWTVEGEIERFGAFGRAAASATGWKRTVAWVMVVLLLAPIALAVVMQARVILGR